MLHRRPEKTDDFDEDGDRIESALRREFPDLDFGYENSAGPDGCHTITTRGTTVMIPASRWQDPQFDPREMDGPADFAASRGSFRLEVLGEGYSRRELLGVVLQALTRCQRFSRAKNRHSDDPLFDRVLARHRAMHDLRLPLVAADYDHALDTWRWCLRLDPDASLAVQIAALFHDVERLVSESERRIEQHAPDYESFKRAHAKAGAEMTCTLLRSADAPDELTAKVSLLVTNHEEPGSDFDANLLNEADALSFFSLNAPDFLDYYGPAHTRKKVEFSLRRLLHRGRFALLSVRHRMEIRRALDEIGGWNVAPQVEPAHGGST